MPKYLATRRGDDLVTDVPEPPNRSVRICAASDGELTVIRRDDERAKEESDYPDERWFDGSDSYSQMTWAAQLEDAVAVFEVSAEPIAKTSSYRA